ncbi:MAG: glycosyltransferase family 2 protein [Alphaproteobacteria bacterium]|nr:glycosyltransferase family 2 protein [Alphaproteobacteria bacterium]MDP6516682.1 glycosyltransferase family 2 protein [Alphaproteobacteria bacterium]
MTSTTSDHAVTVVIPAFNEQDGIGDQIVKVREALGETDWRHELIVVDDGSTDDTAAEAARHDVRLIRQPHNHGYGSALRKGIAAAETEWVLIIDADGTYPARAIPSLLAQSPDHDMVIGARTGSEVHIPLIRRPAKWLLNKLANYLAEQKIPDLNSGLRLMRKPLVARYEHILPLGFSYTTTITLAALCNGHEVSYVSIDYLRRVGRSKIRPAHALQFAILIIRTITLFNPLRIFIPAGAVPFLGGLAKLAYDLRDANISDGAIMGLLAGLLIWSVGILADAAARITFGFRPK